MRWSSPACVRSHITGLYTGLQLDKEHVQCKCKFNYGLRGALLHSSGSPWRRGGGSTPVTGVLVSGADYWPRQLAQKERKVKVVLTEPWKWEESRRRGVDSEVRRRRAVGARGGGRWRAPPGFWTPRAGVVWRC